jgi:L-ascorbate metabolism protein UlaG (beta-lactamase superfamily)
MSGYEGITWLGHASFFIHRHRKNIYIDPWKIRGGHEPADFILVTHSHFDHYDPGDIRKIATPRTRVYLTPDCDYRDKFPGDITEVKPGQTLTEGEFAITTVAAYNTNKDFHKKSSHWVGYVLQVEGQKIYHTGDTDRIPEMKGLEPDFVLIPVSGVYVMRAAEAVDAAKDMAAKTAIPMHWGDIVGDRSCADDFARAFPGKTIILSPTDR